MFVNGYQWLLILFAGLSGFEPEKKVLETFVIPFHHSPNSSLQTHRREIIQDFYLLRYCEALPIYTLRQQFLIVPVSTF